MRAAGLTFDSWLSFPSEWVPGSTPGVSDGEESTMHTSVPLDTQLIALIVHDLRNPLNAIGMALHMIEGEIPEGAHDLRQDVAMIAESSRSLRRMLKILSDYNGLLTSDPTGSRQEFDPRRLITDTVQDLSESSEGDGARIHVEILDSAPPVAETDAGRVRLALAHALGNAVEAAHGAEVRVTVSGEGGRWLTRIASESPPAETVQPGPLRFDQPHRLIGNALERRGLELAIVARVTSLIGGAAAMEVEPGLRSSLVLDWPTHPPGVGSPAGRHSQLATDPKS